jgi:hypothetical protein
MISMDVPVLIYVFFWFLVIIKMQVKRMREEYGKLNRVEMSIWECCELLNEFIDESDPDLDEPQIEHLLQTAEAIRKDYPDEDWLHLTGLIHGTRNHGSISYKNLNTCADFD